MNAVKLLRLFSSVYPKFPEHLSIFECCKTAKRAVIFSSIHLLPESSTPGLGEAPEDDDEEGSRPIDQVEGVRDQVHAGMVFI